MTPSDLIDCPYCCEPIRRQATRCKHCQADLSPAAAGNRSYSTAGGAGSINLGGHFAGIEGGIHITTLAELDTVDEARKRQLLQGYERQVREFPEQFQVQFGLGLSYLDQGLYDLAATALERTLGKTTKEADVLYYLALARLGGGRPRALKLAAIQELERLLTAAIRLNDRAAHYKLLLAAVKYDYYALNGLRVPPPAMDQLLQYAAQGETEPREVRLMLRHLNLPSSPCRSAIERFC